MNIEHRLGGWAAQSDAGFFQLDYADGTWRATWHAPSDEQGSTYGTGLVASTAMAKGGWPDSIQTEFLDAVEAAGHATGIVDTAPL